MEGLESITEEISNNFLYGAFKGAGGLDLLHKVMEQTIEPVSHGYLMMPAEEVTEETGQITVDTAATAVPGQITDDTRKATE